MYIKKVKFKNSLGELVFDNRRLFCEEIDTTGNAVRTASEQLMGTHGNITLSVYLAAKTIPCSFKFVDRKGDAAFRDYIVYVLNPLVAGELTVYAEHDTYTIDCRPSEVPSIARTNVPYVFSWNVDFIADYPLWRKGHQKTIPLEAHTTVKVCKTMPDTPIEIYFPENVGTDFRINDTGFNIGSAHGVGVYVNTKNYTVIGTDGNDYSNLLSVDNISKCVLQNGTNTIFCQEWQDVIVRYYELSLGVF